MSEVPLYPEATGEGQGLATGQSHAGLLAFDLLHLTAALKTLD
jgi:hypothetical protein